MIVEAYLRFPNAVAVTRNEKGFRRAPRAAITASDQGRDIAMMTVKDAERAIIREWDVWAPKNAKGAGYSDGMIFFTHLQRARPDLLEFRFSGDKWQRVHGWLLSNRRVTE